MSITWDLRDLAGCRRFRATDQFENHSSVPKSSSLPTQVTQRFGKGVREESTVFTRDASLDPVVMIYQLPSTNGDLACRLGLSEAVRSLSESSFVNKNATLSFRRAYIGIFSIRTIKKILDARFPVFETS